MTIYIENIDNKYEEICKKDYKNNVFYKLNKNMFVQLISIYLSDNKYFLTILKDKQYFMLKQWIEQSIDDNNSDIKLTFQDKIQLIVNGINHIPTCKCKKSQLKELLKLK